MGLKEVGCNNRAKTKIKLRFTCLALILTIFAVVLASCDSGGKPILKSSGYLNASVRFDGKKFTIRNEDDFDWEDVLMRIGFYSGYYDLRISEMRAGKTYKIKATEFTLEGIRFNHSAVKPDLFIIYSKVPDRLPKGNLITDAYGAIYWSGRL